MEKQKLKHFKDLLNKEKKDVLYTLNLMDSNNTNHSMQEYYDELSMYDNHPADIGTEMFMMEQSMSLKSNEANILSEIETALERIETGSYGICIICGKSIDEERLEILPYINTCIECSKKEIPVENKMNFRPQEEENLEFPFGRSNKDFSIEDSVGFDGEDSLQAVLKFNDVSNDPSFTTGDYQGIFDDEEHGIVEKVEGISEDYYKKQIEDINRKKNYD